MTKLLKNEKIYIREEINGAEATIESGDAVRVMNVSPSPEALRIIDRAGVTGGLGSRAHIFAGTLVAFSFDTEIAVAAATLEQETLLEACGFDVSGGNITLLGKDFKSFTVLLDQDGVGRTITNAVASACSFAAVTGDTLKMSITIVGFAKAEIDTPSPIVPAYSTIIPLVCNGAVASFFGRNAEKIEGFNLDLGLTTAIVPDMLNEVGYGAPRITDRNITGSFNPEMESVADVSWFEQMRADASSAITVKLSRGSDSLTFTIPAPKITDVQDGDRSGLRVKEISFQAATTGNSNNELTMLAEA